MSILKLHPAVYWLETEDDELQIRLPNGDNITIEDEVPAARSILESLRTGTGTADRAGSEQPDDAMTEDLLGVLTQLNALTLDAPEASPSSLRSIAHFYGSAIRGKLSRPLDLARGEVTVTGAGHIADAVRALITRLALPDPVGIEIACADFDDVSFFSGVNAAAVRDGRPITFVRWARDALVIGPLVLSSRGPCYECYVTRLLASAHHVPEMRATLGNRHAGLIDAPDPAFSAMIDFAVGRHVELVNASAFQIAQAGSVERWNALSLAVVERAPLVRIPRCGTCGGPDRSEIFNAVRDVI